MQVSEEGNSEMCGAAKLGIREEADALKHPRVVASDEDGSHKVHQT